MVVTGARVWTLRDGTEHPTGVWAEELAEPHRIFTEAGWDITVATPDGSTPVVDKLSLTLAGMPWKRKRIERYLESIADELARPMALWKADESDYDLVFYPGGHGPMEDLAYDETSGRLLAARLHSGRPLALLCHAPAATAAARNDDGSYAFSGWRMTGLSNAEERLNPFPWWKAKWLLEDKMKEEGILYEKGLLPLRPYVVVDRNLYTGQNPQSSDALANRLVAEISALS